MGRSTGTTARHSWLGLAALAAVGGLTLAAGVAPVVLGVGLAAKAAAQHFEALPAVLSVPPAPQRSVLLAADGSRIATFYAQDRVAVPLAQIAPVMQRAIVGIEDSRFYTDRGVDLRGVGRAAAKDLLAGGTVQGASTLTQQYVKNLLVEAARTPAQQRAARADTVARKLQEARYALTLARSQPKTTILQGYLNTVYFGDGSYGIQAAARHYFSVSAAQLSLPQAALLAGVVQNPTADNPAVHPAAAVARRDVVLTRLGQLHLASAAQLRAAQAAPLGLQLRPHPASGCAPAGAPFFCQQAVNQLLQDPALGGDPHQRQAVLDNGGLVIHTTLDPRAQQAAQHGVALVDPASRAAAALDMVQPGTGRVLAMAVNRPFGSDPKKHQSTVNLATGGASGFQAGSTFKLFTLAAALQQGLSPALGLPAPTSYTATGFTNCTSGAIYPPYTVSNAETSSGGGIDLAQATWESVNTYYLQLEQQTGLCAPAQIANALGVTNANGTPVDPVPSFTLGSAQVSPLAMADAYATIAAHGRYCPPTYILRVTDPHGQQLAPPSTPCRQALPAPIADTITTILQGVIDSPDPNRTGRNAALTVQAAGKTGTTDNYGAAWFDGYTPTLAAATWVGDPTGASHPLTNLTLDGTYYQHVYGGVSIPQKRGGMDYEE